MNSISLNSLDSVATGSDLILGEKKVFLDVVLNQL
jgi:hypothetical protein